MYQIYKLHFFHLNILFEKHTFIFFHLNILFGKHTFEIVANMISKLEGPEELENLYFKIQSILKSHNLV